MKRLAFACILLCCSKAALAADPCTILQGHTISVDAAGKKGLISKISFFPNTQAFITTIRWEGGSLETIEGICSNGHFAFTWARPNPGGFVQLYEGDLSQKMIHGNYSNGQTDHGWYGIVLVNSGSNAIAMCKQDCFLDFGDVNGHCVSQKCKQCLKDCQ